MAAVGETCSQAMRRMVELKNSELDLQVLSQGVEELGLQKTCIERITPDDNEYNHVRAFVEKWDTETLLRLIKSLDDVTLLNRCGKCGKTSMTNYAVGKRAHPAMHKSQHTSLCRSCVSECPHCKLWYLKGPIPFCAQRPLLPTWQPQEECVGFKPGITKQGFRSKASATRPRRVVRR